MMAVLTAVYAFVTQRMVVGRRLYAPVANEKAARLSGVQTERWCLPASSTWACSPRWRA